MYDFALSGYSTVVLTAIYSAYFVGVIGATSGLDSGSATALWTAAIAVANGIVLLSAPIVGAIADCHASKKKFLVTATLLCIAATGGIAAVEPGNIALATALVVFSYVMFASGENLISAFLPEIATPTTMGRTSGYGWSIGYVGGLVTLALCLGYMTWVSGRDQTAAQSVPMTLVITAVMMLLASMVTFIWLKERAIPMELATGRSYVRVGFDRLRQTVRQAKRFQDLFRFLGSLTVFQAGISTVFVVAAIYAQEEMGFSTGELVTMIMVVNITAAAGAYVVGHIQDRLGSRAALSMALATWIVALLIVVAAQSRPVGCLGANLIGIAMGACQASGRALIGNFSPLARTAEFYGLWGLAVNLAAIIGPLSYGLISFLSGGNHRLALLSILTYFVLGWLLLLKVDEQRGIAAATQTADTE
jgi:UMF1 family MFS transporter